MRLIVAIALGLAVCPTGSVTAAGITIITHGFNSNVTDWIIPMAGKVGGYPGFPGATSQFAGDGGTGSGNQTNERNRGRLHFLPVNEKVRY